MASVPPLPHDGWRSRKIIIGSIVLGVPMLVATVCLFITVAEEPIATFDQWVSLLQILAPGVLTPLFVALGIDKLAQAR